VCVLILCVWRREEAREQRSSRRVRLPPFPSNSERREARPEIVNYVHIAADHHA